MLSSKEREFIRSHPNSYVCYDDDSLTTKIKVNTEWKEHPYKSNVMYWEGDHYFIKKEGYWFVNKKDYSRFGASISKTGDLIDTVKAPNASYCEKCLITQFDKKGEVMFNDYEKFVFWNPCPKCKLRKSRSRSSRKWTEIILKHDKFDYNLKRYPKTRFATFTIKDPRWKMQDVFDPLKWDYDFSRSKDLEKFLQEHCRIYYKDGWRYKGLFEINDYLILKNAKSAMRKKLVTRLKNMRHKNKRFMKYVQGGIYCFECTINIHVETLEVSIHPHIHAILYGSAKKYPQEDLTEDWGLGHVYIRSIESEKTVSLEIAKYIGKDGKRYSWGKYRG